MAVDRNVKDEGAFGTWFAFGPIWNLMSDQKIVTVQDIVNECDNNPTYAKMIETWRIAGEMGLGEFAAELGVELIVSGIQKIKDGFQIIKGVLQSKKTDDLINAANEADRAGFTEAGRSLTKKSGRGDAAYPSAKGTAAEINNQAQSLIGGILNNTKRVTTIRHTCRYGYVIEIKIPNGQGVRYDVNGKFIGLINN